MQITTGRAENVTDSWEGKGWVGMNETNQMARRLGGMYCVFPMIVMGPSSPSSGVCR